MKYEKLIHRVPLFEGMTELLKELSPIGISIVSSTASPLINKYLKDNKLDKYIKEILGADVEKSKVIKLKMVLDREVGKNIIFVTDSLGDIFEANKLNINTVAVTWGYHPREILETGKPMAIVDTTEELKDALLR